MATIVFGAINGSWSDDTKWVGGVKPTAADDAQFTVASAAAITIDTGAVCRSLDCNGYTGAVTHSGTFSIGDGTAGAGNRAIRLVSGMTWTNSIGQINFISTSATVQTVDFAGKTTGGVNFNAASNGSWQYTGAHTCPATATLTLTQGTLDLNGQSVSWGLFLSANTNVRSLTTGAATITITGTSNTAWNTGTTTNFTTNFTGSVIILSGSSGAGFTGGGKTYPEVRFTGSGTAVLAGGSTFVILERTGTAAKDCVFSIQGDSTVTGTLKFNGNSAINRLLVSSSAAGTVRTFTSTGATMTWSNVDLADTALTTAFDASAITGLSGDCGGNTNITFTTPATQTSTGTASFNWSTHGWTTRVPLPQDDVVINNAFVGGQTVTADMPRLAKNISFTGATGSPAFSPNISANCAIFGSLTLVSGMTVPSGTGSWVFSGRGSFTVTSAGATFANSFLITAPSGTYTLNDALITTGASGVTLNRGTFNSNGFTVTATSFNSSNTSTRSLVMGSSTWNLTTTSTATVWTIATTTGMTFSGASSTIVITSASTNVRKFSGGDLTYGTLTYTVAGSTGELDIVGSNSFLAINFSDVTNARTLAFTAGTTTTMRSTAFNVNGTSGKLMTIGSITAAGHTLTLAAGTVSCDYLSISRSTAQGGAAWYAGANSTDGGNNSGWVFTAAPVTATGVGGGSGGTQARRNLQNLQNIQ